MDEPEVNQAALHQSLFRTWLQILFPQSQQQESVRSCVKQFLNPNVQSAALLVTYSNSTKHGSFVDVVQHLLETTPSLQSIQGRPLVQKINFNSTLLVRGTNFFSTSIAHRNKRDEPGNYHPFLIESTEQLAKVMRVVKKYPQHVDLVEDGDKKYFVLSQVSWYGRLNNNTRMEILAAVTSDANEIHVKLYRMFPADDKIPFDGKHHLAQEMRKWIEG